MREAVRVERAAVPSFAHEVKVGPVGAQGDAPARGVFVALTLLLHEDPVLGAIGALVVLLGVSYGHFRPAA